MTFIWTVTSGDFVVGTGESWFEKTDSLFEKEKTLLLLHPSLSEKYLRKFLTFLFYLADQETLIKLFSLWNLSHIFSLGRQEVWVCEPLQ